MTISAEKVSNSAIQFVKSFMRLTARSFRASCMPITILGCFSVNAQSFWTNVADTAWYTSNTSAPIYSISTPQQLAGLTVLVNGGNDFSKKTITLEADIDLGEMEWSAIGFTSADGIGRKPFGGHFDGRGKTITGLMINQASSSYSQGLFGYLVRGGSIYNVKLTETNVKGSEYVGGLVGQNHGMVSNCVNAGCVSGHSKVGGVVGENPAGLIHACDNYGTIHGFSAVGGIVGQNQAQILNCENFGAITGTNTVGGVVGYFGWGTIQNSLNAGSVSGTSRVGGLSGYGTGFLQNCLSLGSVVGVNSVGGVMGGGNALNCYWKRDGAAGFNLDAANSGTLTNCYSFTTAPGTLNGGVYQTEDLLAALNAWVDDYAGQGPCFWTTDGSPTGYPILTTNISTRFWQSEGNFSTAWYQTKPNEAVYTISTPQELAGLSVLAGRGLSFANKKVLLASDIDLIGKNWIAIGNESNPFSGIFDGNDKTIRGLTIHSLNYQGLFGSLGNAAIVQNLNLIDTDIKGVEYVGGVAGICSGGVVQKCTCSGQVIGLARLVGGLVGSADSTLIESCLNLSSVKGGGGHCGGLVGYINDGTVRNCTNSGAVTGATLLGGLVGYANDSEMWNCRNAGSVYGPSCVGGVAGRINESKVRSCVNSGKVEGSSHFVGGLVGEVEYWGKILDCSNSGCVRGSSGVGGVAGTGAGTLENCVNSGDISGFAVVDVAAGSGGVAGGADTVVNCSNFGAVSSSFGAGGVVGSAYTVQNCMNFGSVVGPSAGGVVGGSGPADGAVWNCANFGSVSGSASAGGVVGSSSAVVMNCVNSGSVIGVTDVGGVVGYGYCQYSGIIEKCYWRKEGTSGFDLNVVGKVLNNTVTVSNCFSFTTAPGRLDGHVYNTDVLLLALNAWVDEVIDEDVSLFYWTTNGSLTGYPVLYGVMFDAQGGTSSRVMKGVKAMQAYGILPTPTRTGFTFSGWWTEPNGAGSLVTDSTPVTLDVMQTLYAKWTPTAYKVTLNRNGGSGGTTSVTATYGLAMPPATAPTQSGYIFDGYYDSATSSQAKRYYTPLMESLRNWDRAGNVTLYARWTTGAVEPIVVTFDAGGGVADSAFKSVTLGSVYGTLPTATRNGYVFAGWWTGAGGTDTQVVESTVVSIAADHTLYAKWLVGSPGTWSVAAGVAFSEQLPEAFAKAAKVTVKNLPPGLKYNTATRLIEGVPTKEGPYTVVISAEGVAPQTVTITVEALPAWAQGTFNGYVLAGGLATLSVSAAGKVTGKIAFAGTNYSFSAASYASGDSGNGFEIAATAKAGKAALPLALTVWPATNGVAASLGVAAGALDGSQPLAAYRNVWKDADAASLAQAFAGYYTAALAGGAGHGSGYLTLTLDKAGKVKAGGRLADGTAVSLSGTLLLDEDGRLLAAVYAAPSGYKGGSLSGLAEFVRPDAGGVYLQPLGGAPFLWSSRNPAATEVYGNGFERPLPLSGGWYSKTDNLYGYYQELNLAARADTNAPAPELTVGSTRYASAWWNPAGVALTPAVSAAGVMTGLTAPAAGKPTDADGDGAWDYGVENASGLKIALARPTGIFKGTFLCWFDYPEKKHVSKNVPFEGALTPVRENPADGVEGRGYFLWADKAVIPMTGNVYSFKWSYDFLIQGE